MALKAVVDHMRERVLARQVEVEGLGAPRRAEDGAHAAAPDEAAAPNPSGQGALRILPAAHLAARGRCRWSVGGRLAFLRSLPRSALVPSPRSSLAGSAL